MSLGNILRNARESARLSLDDVAAMTSIRAGLIAQMESDDFSGCGGDTYARGHIRTLAAKLRLDQTELLELYNSEHGVKQRRIQDLLVESNVTQALKQKTGISFKTLSLFSLAIVASAALIQIVVSNVNSPSVSQNEVVAASQSPTPSPTPSASATSSGSPAAMMNTLKITAARGNASIDIVVNQEHVYKGWLLQGESKEFSGESRISIYVSNAGDMDITFNGEQVKDLGAQGEEVRRTFG